MAEPHVMFRLGRQAFAIALREVKDVAKAPTITEVPGAEPMVRGLTVLKDTLTTALDLRARLGLSAGSGEKFTALAIDHEGDRVALLVDRVEDVLVLASLKPALPTNDPLWRGVIAGLAQRGEESVIVLDVAAILDGAIEQAAA